MFYFLGFYALWRFTAFEVHNQSIESSRVLNVSWRIGFPAQDLRQSSNSEKVSQIGIVLKISAKGIEDIDA